MIYVKFSSTSSRTSCCKVYLFHTFGNKNALTEYLPYATLNSDKFTFKTK